MNELGEESAGCNRSKRERDIRLFYPRHLENVVDQSQEIFRLGLGITYRRLLTRGHLTEISIGEHLERREHRRQRRLQIVHYHFHEIVAHALQFPELAQTV